MNQTSGYDAWRTGSHEAVATSLLDLKSGIEGIKGSIFKRLEDVTLTVDRVQELFKTFLHVLSSFPAFLGPRKTTPGLPQTISATFLVDHLCWSTPLLDRIWSFLCAGRACFSTHVADVRRGTTELSRRQGSDTPVQLAVPNK